MRARSLVAALGGLLLLTATAPAQVRLSFPMSSDGLDPVSGLALLRPRMADVRALQLHEHVVLTGLVLPGGRRVELDVERVDLERLQFGFQVDGQPAPGLLSGLDLSVWTGTVVGAADSEVVLSFSNSGSHGWVAAGDELVHLLPRPGAGGSWSDNRTLMASEAELAERGVTPDGLCATERLQPLPRRAQVALPPGAQPAFAEGDCETRQCAMAIETDFQLFQVFGDLGAETAYLTTLLAAISDRYEEQIDTVLTFPYVQFYTNSNDPWDTPDVPGSMLDMLDEFVPAWSGAIPAGATLGHFVSGASLGGGVAYLGVLCDTAQEFSFAVSGNIGGDTPFPIAVGPSTWDFMVIAHETGHNFDAIHTHDYVPPVDECAFDICITDGTIMSYCHQCPGGMNNMTLFFHPMSVTDMTAHANACLPLLAPVVPQEAPVLIEPDTVTVLAADVLGTPIGSVLLNYRFDPGDSFATTVATHQGGGVYTASLPGTSCGGEPEWFFSMTDVSCGPYASATGTAEIGIETVLLLDELELASAWTAGAAGDNASSGIWVRNDPIGTGAQPENDHTTSGTNCFFTGQGPVGGGLGDNDVDGGTTTLLSPVIDLSSGDARISYWRWYSNDAGSTPNTDVFTVDISNNGGSSWTNAETVGPAGAGTGGGWIFHELAVSDFVAPTASVRLRFRAADLGDGSLVEAAIDDFKVSRIECSIWEDLGGGTSGIAGVPLLEMSGPLTPLSLLGLDLSAASPSSLAVLFISFSSSPAPFLGGTLHAVPVGELVVLATSAGGGISGSASFPGAPSGTQLWFQFGVFDGSVPIFGASLSNGVVGTVP